MPFKLILFVLAMMLEIVLLADGVNVRYLEIKTNMKLVEASDAWLQRGTNCAPLIHELFVLVEAADAQVLVDNSVYIKQVDTDYFITAYEQMDLYFAVDKKDLIVLEEWEKAAGVFKFARTTYFTTSKGERLVVQFWDEERRLEEREAFSCLPRLKAGKPMLAVDRSRSGSFYLNDGQSAYFLKHSAFGSEGVICVCQVSKNEKGYSSGAVQAR